MSPYQRVTSNENAGLFITIYPPPRGGTTRRARLSKRLLGQFKGVEDVNIALDIHKRVILIYPGEDIHIQSGGMLPGWPFEGFPEGNYPFIGMEDVDGEQWYAFRYQH